MIPYVTSMPITSARWAPINNPVGDALCNANGEQLTVRPGQGLMPLCIDPPVDVPVNTASTIGDDLTMPIGDHVIMVQPVTPPAGWRCPGCQQCFAPTTPKCDTCGPATITTTGTNQWTQCLTHGYMYDLSARGWCPACSGEVTG